MPHGPKKPLLPAQDVLDILDQTVTELSRTAVEFSARMGEGGQDMPCQYQWHKLEKAARQLMQARDIENETLAGVSVLSAQKELISRAVALMDCLRVTGGEKDATAPNLRQPGRRTRKHPWGRQAEDDGTA